MKLLLALIPIALVAQPSGSNTQLQIVGSCSSALTATLEVGTDPSLATLVPDVDPAKFSGSNAATRAGNVIIGNNIFFNVGTRIAQQITGTVNSVINPPIGRSLQANTNYWYRWTCNGTPDSIRGPLQTGTLATGNTWLDPIPPSTDAAGKSWAKQGWLGYPVFTKWAIGDATARAEQIIDPQSGAAIQRMTLPDDRPSGDDWNFAYASGANWTASDGGTLIHAVSVDDSIFATNSTTNDWLITSLSLLIPGKQGGSDTPNQGILERAIANVKAYYTGSGHNIEVALSADGGVTVWPTSANVYTVAVGNTAPSTFATYGGGSMSMYPWTPAGVQPLQSGDVSFRGSTTGLNGNVTVDVSGTVSWVLDGASRSRFNQQWKTGTPIVIGNSACTIATYINPERLTVVPTSCTPALAVPITTAVHFQVPGLTLMIRRPSGVTDALHVQYGKINISYGNSGLSWTSGGQPRTCSDNLKLNTVTGHLGSLCIVGVTFPIAWWIDSTTGVANQLATVGTPGGKAGVDGWLAGNTTNCPKTGDSFIGTGPTSLASLYCMATDNIGKRVILSCNLMNAAGTGLPTYQSGNASLSCVNVTPSSKNADIVTLLTGFTAGQVSQFDPTLFTSIDLSPSNPWSDEKVWIFISRGGQDTIGWYALFDPTKVGTAPGCIGGGLAGCIVAAKDSWSAFPDRWDSVHALDAAGNVALTTGHGMGSVAGSPGGNLYSFTILNAQLSPTPAIAAGTTVGGVKCPASGLGCDIINVDGEPCVITPAAASGGYPAEPLNCPKNPAQSWIQNTQVGDPVQMGDCITTTVANIGCSDRGHQGEIEFLKILSKTGNPWSSSMVQRGWGTSNVSKTYITNGNYTSVSATKTITFTSKNSSPGMVGGTIYLNGVPFTVATYIDTTHITVTTDPGTHASGVPWIWPHQASTNIVNSMSSGRPLNNDSYYPGPNEYWDYGADPHGTNATGNTLLVPLVNFWDHNALNYNPDTSNLLRIGGANSSDPNLPSGAGYSIYQGPSKPISSYPPTGYSILGAPFNNSPDLCRFEGVCQEHPSVGALGVPVFNDVRPISGLGNQTVTNVSGNLWKMTTGLNGTSGDIVSFVGFSSNAVCNTNGTAVTWVSGDQFTSVLTQNTSGVALYYWVGGVGHSIASITDPTHLVLGQTAGIQTGVPCNGGTTSAGFSRKLQTVQAWCGSQPLVDVSSPTVTLGGTSTDQFKWGVARKAGELVTGSNQGDMFFNCPFIGPRTQIYNGTFGCTQAQPDQGTTADICVAQTGSDTNVAVEMSAAYDVTGGLARNLTHQLLRNHMNDVNGNAHATADGKYLLTEMFANPGSEFEILTVTIPLRPDPDAYDRTRYVPVLAALPMTGSSIPVGAVSARVAFGYAEYGAPTSYFGTTRQEKTYANTTGLIPNVPFLYGTTDGPVAGLACAGGCTVWVPGIPEHTVSMAAEWLDSGGIVLRTDVLPSVIVAPAPFVNAPGCTISPASLATGTVGSTYTQGLVAINCGSGTLTWTTTGLLPNGLGGCNGTTGISCTIQGTPTVAGSTLITVQVTDGGSNTATMPYTIVIANPTCSIAPASVPNGTTGIAYSQSLTASGCGTNTLTWSISGALPNGLSISSSTGAITGTPTVANNFNFTVKVTDGAFNTDTNVYAVTILAPVSNCAISTTSLVGGTVGVPYSQVVTATNCGGGTLTWSTTGTLPSGITGCNGTHGTSCTYSGTPSVAGNFPITTGVTDGGSNSDTNPFTITVVQPTPPPTSGTSLIRSGTLVTSGTIAH